MLKPRLPTLSLKHPSGASDHDPSSAVVSLKPRLRAALSHVALSVIPFLPDTEPHVPLSTCEYATECATLSQPPAPLLDLKQNKPESEEQSTGPQRQAAELVVTPSELLHGIL